MAERPRITPRDAGAVPAVREDLRSALPADTPVVSPEERDRQLRDRLLGAQMRRKW